MKASMFGRLTVIDLYNCWQQSRRHVMLLHVNSLCTLTSPTYLQRGILWNLVVYIQSSRSIELKWTAGQLLWSNNGRLERTGPTTHWSRWMYQHWTKQEYNDLYERTDWPTMFKLEKSSVNKIYEQTTNRLWNRQAVLKGCRLADGLQGITCKSASTFRTKLKYIRCGTKRSNAILIDCSELNLIYRWKWLDLLITRVRTSQEMQWGYHHCAATNIHT